MEAFKAIEGVEHSINPTQFLQPNLSPRVNVEFGCNDFVTYVSGVVVDRRPVARATLETDYIGNPLIEGLLCMYGVKCGGRGEGGGGGGTPT